MLLRSTTITPWTRSLTRTIFTANMANLEARQSVADLIKAGRLSPTQASDHHLRYTNKLFVQKGDITKLKVDAIVNAANERMLGGGGVDGAIHRAAGPELLAECYKVLHDPVHGTKRCPTGEARLTLAGKLPAKYVVHTVGPVYHAGNAEAAATLLSNAYRNSLQVAAQAGATSIAFPSISTGTSATDLGSGPRGNCLRGLTDLESFFLGWTQVCRATRSRTLRASRCKRPTKP